MVAENVSTILVALVVGKFASIVVVTKLLEAVLVVVAGCNICEPSKEVEVDEIIADDLVLVLGDDLFTGATGIGVVLPVTQHCLETFAFTDSRV